MTRHTDDADGTIATTTYAPLPSDPPWLVRAFADLGKAETPGTGSAAWILQLPGRFARWVQAFYRDDSQAWCALWAGACLVDAGCTGLPKNPLGALAYAEFGVAEGTTVPTEGRVFVPGIGWVRRGALVGLTRLGGGHIGFLLDYYPARRQVILLSGNSKDRVGVDGFPRDRVRFIRWPQGV